jgi:L-2-hydroxyglutarate oxidase LhgO
MNLASEIAGSDALVRIQNRVQVYWERQLQKRLVATLNGVIASNTADDAGDMVLDISAETGTAANFSAAAVIDAAGTMGDALADVTGIAMHGDVYRAALKADLIEFVKSSDGSLLMPTFRGLAVVQDDGMPVGTGKYTTALFGSGAFGYAMSAPRVADGTELENLPSAGNGGGQQVLHSRVNLGLHPAGFNWNEAAVLGESPTIAELSDATNWSRIVERKATPLAFLVSKI